MHYQNSFFVQDAALNAASPILRVTRAGETAWGPLPGDDWTVFTANHSTYEPLAWANNNSQDWLGDADENGQRAPLITVLQVRVVNILVLLNSFLEQYVGLSIFNNKYCTTYLQITPLNMYQHKFFLEMLRLMRLFDESQTRKVSLLQVTFIYPCITLCFWFRANITCLRFDLNFIRSILILNTF